MVRTVLPLRTQYLESSSFNPFLIPSATCLEKVVNLLFYLNVFFILKLPSCENLPLIAFPLSSQKYGRGWKKLQNLHAKGQVTSQNNSPSTSQSTTPVKKKSAATQDNQDKQSPARDPSPAPPKHSPALSPSAGSSEQAPPPASSPTPAKAPQKGWL